MKKTLYSILLRLMIIVVVPMLLLGCGKQEKKTKKERIVVAKLVTPVSHLFFPGTLYPIRTQPVVSPVQGRVAKIEFEYGQEVIKGQELVMLASVSLAQNYRKAINDYLQKKNAYENGIQTYQGDVALYKAGVTSRQTFLSAQSTYENNVLNFYQARYNLQTVLGQIGIDPKAIERLTLADTEAINKLLNRKFQHIRIKAPASGIVLFPVASASGSQKSGKLSVGGQVKKGQLILSIGDLSGYRANISVSETNINRLKVGMAAKITGSAFPGIVLDGKLTTVTSQAKPGSASVSGVSQFGAVVEIPNVKPAVSKIVHVGMTAKIDIPIKGKPVVQLPLSSVKRKNGRTYVTVVDANNKRQEVSVLTGTTTPDGQVAIISGIKTGDKVVAYD